MTSTNPSETAASAPPTPTRETLLAEAHPVARAVDHLVRSVLDDLEASAPWDELHSPPEGMGDLLQTLSSLLEVVDTIPERFVSLQASHAEALEDSLAGQILVDARFYFEGIHAMVIGEIENLRSSVDPLKRAPVDLIDLPPDRKAYLCELAADLKGKYGSALMGAAVSLVVREGNATAMEPILFEEKADEFRRNRRLVRLLVEILDRLQKLQTDVRWEAQIRTWHDGGVVDPYALRPVVTFIGSLGRLLEGDGRRALYSGDFHAIHERRKALTTRINALSTLLLMESGRSFSRETSGQRALMIRRAAEIAVLLDREGLLPKVIGARSARHLLEAAQAKTLEDLPPTLEILWPLVQEDDLETFLKSILRSVLKRGSLVLARKKRRAAERRAEARSEPPPPPSSTSIAVGEHCVDDADGENGEVESKNVGTKARSVSRAEDSDSAQLGADEAPRQAEAPIPSPSPASASGKAAASSRPRAEGADEASPKRKKTVASGDKETERAAGEAEKKDVGPAPQEGPPVVVPEPTPLADPPASEEERATLIADVQAILDELRSAEGAHRKPYDFIHRMLDQHRAIPPGMVRSIVPFLDDLGSEVVPRIARLSAGGDLPHGAVEQLRRSLSALGDPSPPPAWIRMEMGPAMGRLAKYLDALAATLDELG